MGRYVRSSRSSDLTTVADKREERCRELQEWFIASQIFVNKAIRRGHQAEALAAYWATTLKPLAELLRMRHSPARWDFGMRYMDRDLPPGTYQKFCDLMLVHKLVAVHQPGASCACCVVIDQLRACAAAPI